MANKEATDTVDIRDRNEPGDVGDVGTGGKAFKEMAKKLEENLRPFREAPKESAKEPAKEPAKAKETVAKAEPAKEPAKKEAKAKEPEVAPHIKTITGKKPEEAPAQEAVTEDDETQDDVVPESIKGAKAADDWKKSKIAHREHLKAKDAKIRELETKLQSVASTKGESVDKTELEKIAKERDELLQKLETVSLERSPRFQQKYQGAFDRAVETAKNAVGAAHAEKIASLMNLPESKWRDEQIEAIREDLSGLAQGRLDQAIFSMDNARQDMQRDLSNSKEHLKEIMESEQAQSQQANQMQLQKLDERMRVAREVANQSNAFLPVDGDDEHNQAVESRLKSVENFFKGEVSEEDLITLPLLAEESKYLSQKVLPELYAENQRLKKELEAIGGSTPSHRRGSPSTNSSGKKKSFIERFQENWEG